MQMVRTADTNELDKLIFREGDNDRKVTCQIPPFYSPLSGSRHLFLRRLSLLPHPLIQVVLQLEKKLFSYVNQDVFRENNGTPVGRAPLNGVFS